MNQKKQKNETGRSIHQNTRTLEEAVEHFIADVEEQLERQEKDTGHRSHYNLSNISGPLRKLRAAFASHMGRAPEVPRSPYARTSKKTSGGLNEKDVEERHESYGLVHISRVQGGRRLFGSSVNHQHYFVLRILRGRRVMTTHGENYWDDHRVPIVEIALSPAQFVEMITSQNLGSGVPCTLMDVEGVPMDPTPDNSGSEIKMTVEMFEDRLVEMVDELREHDKNLHKLLEKKTFNKDDKEQIQRVVTKVRRLMDDSAPHAMKLMGEHTEKLIAKGKMELDAFIQLAINRAGIKAIKDNNGTLMLGSGDEDDGDRKE